MHIKNILPAFLLLSLPAIAMAFEVEEKGLSSIPSQAELEIMKDEFFSENKGCKVVGKTINLGGQKEAPAYIATTYNGCGWAAASAPIWIVTLKGGKAQVMLFEYGYSVTFGKHTQARFRNVAISTGTAGWYSESLWKFDGNKYLKVKQLNGPAR